MAASVVLEEHAPRIDSVATRNAAPAHEEIDRPISVKITGSNARTAEPEWRYPSHGFREGAYAVIQVKPAFERRRTFRILTPACDDVEIRMTIAVGVEKDGADVFGDAVLRQELLVASREGPVCALNEDFAGLSLGAADENVVKRIAVDVGDGHQRPFGRQHLGHQALAL